MTAPGPRLLVVEDEEPARRTLAAYLVRRDYRVQEAATAADALRAWAAQRPDVMLLDLGLPDLDGVEVIRRVRRDAATPIIILSARGDERDRIAGLEAGADDYLSKPYAVDELHARIRAVLRRAGGPAASPDGRLRLGPIELDQTRREVQACGTLLRLTPHEYELLKVLMSNRGRVVTRERLLRAVWGQAYADATQYVHVYVSRLRRKLAAAGVADVEQLIATETGVGYRVSDPDPGPEPDGSRGAGIDAG